MPNNNDCDAIYLLIENLREIAQKNKNYKNCTKHKDCFKKDLLKSLKKISDQCCQYNDCVSCQTIYIPGLQGIQGIPGEPGEPGTQGIQGIPGQPGEQGIQGITGEQGIQGTTGDQGIQGITGDQGIQGITGDQGKQGYEGQQGDQGNQGEKGDQGITGDQGPSGDPGKNGVNSIWALSIASNPLISSTSPRYFNFYGSNRFSREEIQVILPRSYTFEDLYFEYYNASNDLPYPVTCTIYKNATATILSTTINPTAVGPAYKYSSSNTINSISFNVGEYISIELSTANTQNLMLPAGTMLKISLASV